jgi:hypothetical protein
MQKIRFIKGLMLSAVLLSATGSRGENTGQWQQFRALGGRSLEGAIKSITTDSRYVYIFSASGGARYDQLLGKWEFSVPPSAPPGGFSFAALDYLTGDIYFAQGTKLIPYGTIAKAYFREISLPALPLALAFDGQGIWIRTSQGTYLCDRWNRKVKAESDSGKQLEWQGQLDLNKVKRDPRFFGLAPYYIMDDWALAHHLTGLSLGPGGPTAWLSFGGLGLWKYDLFTRRLEQFSTGFLASSNVSAIAAGSRIVLMVGDGGLTAVGGRGMQWQHLDRLFNIDLNQYKTRAMVMDGRDIFIGTDQGVLSLEVGSDFAGTINTYQGLPEGTVNCLYLDGDALWVGMNHGLACYQRGSREALDKWPMLERYQINGISGDRDFIYLATDRGGIRLDKSDSLKAYGFENTAPGEIDAELVSVAVWDSLVWWLGRDFLVSYNKSTSGWFRYPRAGNYAAGQGQCLALDSANLWIGTDNGLVRFIKSQRRFLVYHTAQGLLDEQVWAVCSFDGQLWAGGPSGVSCFNWVGEGQ